MQQHGIETGVRVFDNTLPQSAYMFFSHPDSPFLDSFARDSFIDFVNGYVHSKDLYVPLPDEEKGERDPFVRLTHTDATAIENNAASSLPGEPSSDVLTRFVESLDVQPAEWAKFLRFQWTPSIITQFKSRVPRWRDEIAEQLQLLYPKISDLSPAHDQRLNNVLQHVQEAFVLLKKEYGIDREYSNEARRRANSNESLYALAWGLNFFSRGQSYAQRFPDRLLRFYRLRDGAPLTKTARHRKHDLDRVEINFGGILGGFRVIGDLSGDGDLFAEKLHALREFVGTDEFQARQRSLPQHSEDDRNDLILDALTKIELPPVHRATYARRHERLREAFKGAQDVWWMRLCFLLIDYAKSSKTIRRKEVSFRKFLKRPSLWKVFRWPDLDDH